MEFYLSFHELLGRGGNSLALIFLPLFLVMTVLEGLIILYRQGAYPWKNAGIRKDLRRPCHRNLVQR